MLARIGTACRAGTRSGQSANQLAIPMPALIYRGPIVPGKEPASTRHNSPLLLFLGLAARPPLRYTAGNGVTGRIIRRLINGGTEAMSTDVLSPDEIELFIESGYAMVRQAFTARQAAVACEYVWRRMEQKAGIRKSDPSTWPERYDIEEHLRNPEVLECFTDRIANAIGQLVGYDRWRGERRWGLWPVNFSFGRSRPYDFPTTGWHIDGNWFTHTVNSPKQGLLVVGLFTDIEPRGGGTILSLGSHKRTARVLAGHPEGIGHRDLFREVLSEPIGNFHEVTGSAGDVVLAHPFLFHTKGIKHVGGPRIISNTEAGLRQPMVLSRTLDADYSILEESIRKALREAPAVPPDARACRF